MSWDDLERRFLDIHAADQEHSHVSADTFRRIEKVISAAIEASKTVGMSGAPSSVIAKLVVEDLDDEALEEIVRDWLEGRGRGGL
jgi:hypothetical protein